MEIATPLSCPLPPGPLNVLFKGGGSELERQRLRDEMRGRLHPITCRICRQELAYFRDVGRFPLEEDEVQGAYLQGRGYRFLLTVWWARISDHLAGDLREMPAVSSYYRHMSFHLGVRTERDGAAPEEHAGTSFLARSGGFASSPDTFPSTSPSPVLPMEVSAPTARPSFPAIIPVPVPESSDANPWAPVRVETSRGERSVLRMARTMVQLNELSTRRVPPNGEGAEARPPSAVRGSTSAQRSTSEWLGRAAGASSNTGGYATRFSVPGSGPDPKRRRAPARG